MIMNSKNLTEFISQDIIDDVTVDLLKLFSNNKEIKSLIGSSSKIVN